MKSLFYAGLIAVLATSSLAHSPLNSTIPADGAVMAEMPTELVLDFKSAIRLTRLTLTQIDAPSIDLDLSAHTSFVLRHAMTMPTMGTGTYLIEWRGLSADGHAMSGTFGFLVE